MNLSVRLADVTDLHVILALSVHTFTDTYAEFNREEDMQLYVEQNFNELRIMKELSDPASIFLLAMADDHPAGYAKLKIGMNPVQENIPSIEIARFYADRKFIGKGIGKILLENCVRIALEKNYDTTWLVVWNKNNRAIEFYKKWGFEIAGDIVFLLGNDRQSDYIMIKRMNHPS